MKPKLTLGVLWLNLQHISNKVFDLGWGILLPLYVLVQFHISLASIQDCSPKLLL